MREIANVFIPAFGFYVAGAMLLIGVALMFNRRAVAARIARNAFLRYPLAAIVWLLQTAAECFVEVISWVFRIGRHRRRRPSNDAHRRGRSNH